MMHPIESWKDRIAIRILLIVAEFLGSEPLKAEIKSISSTISVGMNA